MAKRGKTPSLIGGCDCIEVKVPSTMGCKCYCIDCFKEVLDQTQHDLDNLVAQVVG